MIFFLMGLQKLHVVDYTSVTNGEVGVGSGSGGVGRDDNVIQFKTGYNEVADRNLGEDEEEPLQG